MGQTMVTAGFFVLLTIAVISANRMVIESNRDYLKTEAVEQATNFANALIGEILTKKFDSNVTLDGSGNVTGPYIVWLDGSGNVIGPYGGSVPSGKRGPAWPTTPTLFDDPTIMGTSAATMAYVMPGGVDSITVAVPYYKSVRGDTPSYMDDVDDYHGYVRAASSADISGYRLTVSVYYVKKTSPNTASTTQTYYKRVDVVVSHSLYLPKSLTFSAIATY